MKKVIQKDRLSLQVLQCVSLVAEIEWKVKTEP
jgi:hypothetical protein